ncbi:MAG: phospholipid carrier-dependent glycosyltransferase [Candidatus Omnitrophica bacterium]|nr:phospholipid carrier-dependent glycosyltransferase [Candidatus Omnitrophota bacterium]
MSTFLNCCKPRNIFVASMAMALILGVMLRLYNLLGSGFFFYDEGLYLNHNLLALEWIRKYHPQGMADNVRAFLAYLKIALGSGKSLWFLVIDSRFLIGGIHVWSFAKGAACFFGLMVLPIAYAFAKRFYRSKDVALLTVGLMALLPGAVFYSRIALQEAFSTVLVLSGFYVYLFFRRFEWRVILSGVILAAAFFANYRLLMLPFLVLAAESWVAVSQKKAFNARQYIWFCISFFACVVLIGSVLDAANMRVVFSWVFHQEQMASEQFSWMNLMSYPYYLFRLETWPFAFCFFAGISYMVWRRRWVFFLPAILVLVQMGVFSLTSEKGARYIAVVLPFVCMVVSYGLLSMWEETRRHWRRGLLLFAACVLIFMAAKSIQLSQASSAHEKAVKELLSRDPDVKFFSSQELVDVLYLEKKDNVQAIPRDFQKFSEGFEKGYRYLILDPQSYVSLTQGAKFTKGLREYLGFIDGFQVPTRTYPHMNRAFLDRFVLEHSESLSESIAFINNKDIAKFSSLRVYDLSYVVPQMRRFVDLMKMKKP